MIELKFTAEKLSGEMIGSVVAADSFTLAKEKANLIASQNNLKIKSFEKKTAFIYKVKKTNNKNIQGEMNAFNKQEVIDALTRLGYQVISVNTKLLNFNRKPSQADILNFVKISADMLEQKLSYGETLSFLINDTRNKIFKEVLMDISKELKKGTDGEVAFMRHKDVLGKFTAYMLGLASKSGNMSEIYRATAKFLERKHEFKKSLRSALITPLFTVIVLFAAVVWYVAYIFPEIAKLFLRFKIELPPMTAATLDVSDFLVANMIPITLLTVLPPLVLWRMYKHPKGRLKLDEYLMKIPYIGDLIHRTYIEIFCRVFYTLYTGSAVSIAPIKVAAESTDNTYFEKQVVEVGLPLMMERGAGITEGMAASGVFTDTALSKFKAGEETGNIKRSALQLADYYESDTTYRLNNFIEWVQIAIAMIILVVMVFITLVSAETAVIRPNRNQTVYNMSKLIQRFLC